ncbi:MAG TPA: DUF2127 domain-containing protein [Kofleriaceae bacterium]|nr:DUF2127 domain-containing protein [Kofleriaceae bacterium]
MTSPLAHKVEEVAAHISETVKTEVERVDFGLRVIIVWKAIKAVLLFALGIAAFALVHSDVAKLGTELIAWLGIDAGRPTVQHVLAKLAGLTPHRISVIGIGAIIYACVLALEGWGLHRRYLWADWLTVIVTSSLIPLEIYELFKHPSVGKVIALVVNVAIVMYLLRHKWLFRK